MPSLFVSLLKHLFSRMPPPEDKTLAELASKDRTAVAFRVPDTLSPIQEGRKQLEAGNWMEALSIFHLATQKSSQNNWAWHGKGDAFQLLGDHPNAQKAYEQAILLSPQTGLHYGGLSNALRAQNKTASAEEMWEKALELDPSLTWMRSTSS